MNEKPCQYVYISVSFSTTLFQEYGTTNMPPTIPSNKGGRAYSGRGRQRKAVRVNPRNLKKTTKKGAYKPTVKKQFMKRRNPFVENKIRNEMEFSLSLSPTRPQVFGNFPDPTNFSDIPVDDAFTLFLPAPFYSMNRGLNHNEMIGDSIYAKYLKTKFQFLAPSGANMIDYPTQLYLIHGWCTAPLNATSLTTPQVQNVTYTDMFNHIRHYVKEYYNDRKDTLQFPEKRERHIQFLSRRKLTTDKNSEIPLQGVSDVATTRGALAPINMSVKWDIMKKVHYDKGANNSANGDPSIFPMADFNYPNQSWLPFTLLYNPQFASTPAGAGNQWQVAHNSQLWYSDS